MEPTSMNERIRQLAEKAGSTHKQNLGVFQFYSDELEKFAELIVLECIEKITTYDLVPGHSAKWEDIYDIHARLLQDLGEELKEHFGVTK
jgi:MoaA/NifB/PqqE/SkfB family radical SAM enzyme